jgi:hypothetical protein
MIDNLGEDHARMVLMTLAETANNKSLLDEVKIWIASDMLKIFRGAIDADPVSGSRPGTRCRSAFCNQSERAARRVKPRFALGGWYT